MKKAIAGAFVGAVVYFVWGFVSWMVLPWHAATIKALPNETLISDTLKTVLKEPGFYVFPHDMHNPTPTQPDGQKAWAERVRSGPLGTIAFSPTGREPMSAGTFVTQFLSGLGVAALLLLVLTAARRSWTTVGCRVLLSAAVGLCAALAGPLQNWIWFNFPWDATLVSIFDLIIGFALTGAALAAFVPEE